MAWVQIANSTWEYSTTPEIDDPDNAHNYTGKHAAGIRTNANDGTQVYVFCRKISLLIGSGLGELRKF